MRSSFTKVIGQAVCALVLAVCLSVDVSACDNCIAKAKSQQQANEGRMRHVGGSMGTGRFEGVGRSSVSAEHAIRMCCYYGKKPLVGSGVIRGRDGSWYACCLYR